MSCCAPCPTTELLAEGSLSELAPEWQELLEHSYDNRIFLTPDWHQVWRDYNGSSTAHILTLRGVDNELRAILPLQIAESSGRRILTLLGDHNVADYMDGLAQKSQAQTLLESLWSEALVGLDWDRVELRHVPSSSPLVAALHSAAHECGLSLAVDHDEVCPVAILCNTWEGYLEMLSKKQRHEIRRKFRRATEDAVWSWRTVRAQNDLDHDLPIFFRLHEASAREKARFLTEDMRAFFQTLSARFLELGILRLSVFRRDGVDVAATMSFLYRSRYLLYNSGYDPAYASYSPGIAAVALAMQDAIEHKAVAFDFLSGDEPYKYQFGATNTHTCRVEILRRV